VCDVYTHEVTTGEGAGSLAALRLTFLRRGFEPKREPLPPLKFYEPPRAGRYRPARRRDPVASLATDCYATPDDQG
jgi:hypothetical protein